MPDELIQEKTYIKLDASSDDAFFKKISKIKIVRNKIYISDNERTVQKLLVFNIDGSFEGLVGRRGQGPGEYLQVSDFDVSTDGTVYVIDGQSDRLFIFDSAFHFVSARKLPFEIDIIHSLSNNQYLLGLSSWNTGETC
ncbi:MAG: 6-bladed beta-propeller, partial [Prevotellaceae bacterium]|nr:6-bladed beta-propeller [Prevotellaceae bacterium]